MDEISIKGLKLFSYHGVLEKEKKNGQLFLVDITIFTSIRTAGKYDKLDETVNYGVVSKYVKEVFRSEYFNLIEAAAENLAYKLLTSFDKIREVEVTVHKPDAPIDVGFDDVSVTIRRGWHTAYIAVGSNMGDSAAIIERGYRKLFSDNDMRILRKSSYIVTAPYGFTDQPSFLNGLWKAETLLSPEELLDRLHEVERSEHRERKVHWGPRTLDLDIIYYDDVIADSAALRIPHEDMQNREFVLRPLMEVDPYVRHPINRMTAEEMLQKLSEKTPE